MGRGTKTTAVVSGVALALLLAGCATVRVSVASGGGQADGDSNAVAVGGDGRFVAFISTATNLVPGDTNGEPDVFVRDRIAGTTRLASVAADGGPANGASTVPSISADGRIVAFTSRADNLTTDTPEGGSESYVRDLTSGVTTRLDQQSGFAERAGAGNPRVSTDGRFVAFQQLAVNRDHREDGLVHVFVRDLSTGETQLVSTPADGPAPKWADSPSLSADGRYVAYVAQADAGVGAGPVVPDGNTPRIPIVIQDGGPDRIQVLDRTTGRRVTAPEVRITSAPGWQVQMTPSISADGRFVAFSVFTLSLVAGGTNDVPQIWLWDTLTDRLRNVSRLSGSAKTTWALQPSVSRDGRRVAFTTVTSGASAPLDHVVVYDRRLGVAPIIDLPDAAAGAWNGPTLALTDTGEALAFTSRAADLVSHDTNGSIDVFVRSLDRRQFHLPHS